MSMSQAHTSSQEDSEYEKYSLEWFSTWFSSRAQKKYHDFYYWCGYNMWIYPWRFIAIGVLILLIFIGGFFFVTEETR